MTTSSDDIRLAMAYFGLSDGYTEEMLKQQFKLIARNIHPSAPNGNEDSYKVLLNLFRLLYKHIRINNTCEPPAFENKSFNNNAFNDMFEKYKDNFSMSPGYERYMVPSTPVREEINIDRVIDTTDGLNKEFEKIPVDDTKYEVAPMYSGKLGFQEMGVDSADFTGNSSSHLTYTDYMKAHTTRRIAGMDNEAERPLSLEEAKKLRKRTNYKYANEEDYESMKRIEESIDIKRINNMLKENNSIEQNWNQRNIALSSWMNKLYTQK
jgi:hypothetical protein